MPYFPSQSPHSFTDEADQQRALIEMHGLYCLSRPSEYIRLFFRLIETPLVRLISAHISCDGQAQASPVSCRRSFTNSNSISFTSPPYSRAYEECLVSYCGL
jgi:hypothetical protein